MKIVKDKITLTELQEMSQKMFENIVKAVVDIEQEIMVVDAPFHADEEQLLLEEGSQQENLWGINLLPEHFGTENFVVFDSMINLRPFSNPSQGMKSGHIEKIDTVVKKLVAA